MAFEAVLVAHLAGACLAVPAQPLEAFAFELVGQVFGAADLGSRHGGGLCRDGRNGRDQQPWGGGCLDGR